MKRIYTRKDVLRYTATRVAITVFSTIILTVAMNAIEFGMNPDTTISLARMTFHNIAIGVIIAALLTGVLTYRSGMLMQELNLARTELLRLSRTDALTGLLNRRGYDKVTIEALEKAGRSGVSAVALMCDIDRFKIINDEFGHEFGDKVLVEIAATIRAFGDANAMVVARHGGEEFAVLMTGVTTAAALEKANALRQKCAATRISKIGGGYTSVTISIGLATANDPTTLPTLMRAADHALYQAKHGGRDRVVPTDVAAENIAA